MQGAVFGWVLMKAREIFRAISLPNGLCLRMQVGECSRTIKHRGRECMQMRKVKPEALFLTSIAA